MRFSVVQDFAAASQRKFDSLEPVNFGSPWPGIENDSNMLENDWNILKWLNMILNMILNMVVRPRLRFQDDAAHKWGKETSAVCTLLTSSYRSKLIQWSSPSAQNRNKQNNGGLRWWHRLPRCHHKSSNCSSFRLACTSHNAHHALCWLCPSFIYLTCPYWSYAKSHVKRQEHASL